jgi:hypothetical protein
MKVLISMTRVRAALTNAMLAVLWISGSTAALYFKHAQLFASFDGGYFRELARRQFEWHVPIFSASMDLFQGLGDISFPLNLTLFPSFIVALPFGSGTAAKVVTYGWILAELSIATLLFGRSLGASRHISVAAALLTCLLYFPLYGRPGLIHMILAVGPWYGTLIAASLAMAAAFLCFGRRNWLADLPFALLIFALLAWMVLAGITFFTLAGPFLLLCVISGILAAADNAERWCKIALALIATVFLTVSGPALYLGGLLLDTAASTFPRELSNDRATFYYSSILFHWKSVGPAGPLLVIFAIAGATLSIFDRTHRTLRIFAITLLTYLGTRLTFAVLTIVFDFWRGPSPLYFEFFVIPLYAIFATLFLGRIFEFLRATFGWRPLTDRRINIHLVASSTLLAVGFAVGTRSFDYRFQFPPDPTSFTLILAEESGVRPGSVFRGRAANMTGRSMDRAVNWFDLITHDWVISGEIGNELRVTGLNFFGIPSLFEYVPTMTPAFYATTSRLLAMPGDVQMRSVSVLRNIAPRILAMLGVRFVITDAPFNGAAKLRADLPMKDQTLYLLEIARPNLGDYSPTIVTKSLAAEDIIKRMGEEDFDPSREIIADVTAQELEPARHSRLVFDGVSLKVEAESLGRSILLLPLEFSRCLESSSVQSGKPLLFRANLVETGVLFSGQLNLTLSIRTGPFLNPGCRLRDYFEVGALRIGEVPVTATDR